MKKEKIKIVLFIVFVAAVLLLTIKLAFADNVTLQNCTNTTTYICNATYFEIFLDPGQYLQENNSQCFYNATCSACNTTNQSTCYVHKDLDPNDHYILKSGVCDIDIDVDDCDDQPSCDYSNETLEWIVPFEFEFYNDSVSIMFNNETYRQTGGVNDGFYYYGRTSFECPMIQGATEGDNTSYTFDQCQRWLNAVDTEEAWMLTMTSLLTSTNAVGNLSDSLILVANDRDHWRANYETSASGLDNCKSNLIGCENQTNLKLAEKNKALGDLQRCQEENDQWLIILLSAGAFLFFIMFGGGAGWVLYFKEKNK